MRKLIAVLIFIVGIGSSYAQQPAVNNAIKEEMKKFAPWVGQWKGEGSVRTRSGKTEKSSVTETIQYKLDGTLLLVEGLGVSVDEATKQERTTHSALGVLTYNTTDKQFKFRSWLFDGKSTDAWFTVKSENEYAWGFDFPQGKIRYSIKLTATTWNEVGEYSTDGTQWVKTFEMNLTKQ